MVNKPLRPYFFGGCGSSGGGLVDLSHQEQNKGPKTGPIHHLDHPMIFVPSILWAVKSPEQSGPKASCK